MPHPSSTDSEPEQAEKRSINQEKQEGFVVAKTDAGSQPGAVVVHLEDASLAGRAMMGSVGLPSLAFLAVSNFAVALDRE